MIAIHGVSNQMWMNEREKITERMKREREREWMKVKVRVRRKRGL